MRFNELPPDIQKKHDDFLDTVKAKREDETIPLRIILDMVKQCTVRKTKPIGPMIVCHDMICLDECITQTKRDFARIKEREKAKNES